MEKKIRILSVYGGLLCRRLSSLSACRDARRRWLGSHALPPALRVQPNTDGLSRPDMVASYDLRVPRTGISRSAYFRPAAPRKTLQFG